MKLIIRTIVILLPFVSYYMWLEYTGIPLWDIKTTYTVGEVWFWGCWFIIALLSYYFYLLISFAFIRSLFSHLKTMLYGKRTNPQQETFL